MLRVSLLGLILVWFSCGLAQPALAIHQLAAQDNWARYSPGEADLSIELPGKPVPYNTPIPEAAKNQIADVKGFMSYGSHMVVVLNRFVTTDAIIPKGVATEMMTTVAKDASVSELTYSTEASSASQATIKATWKTNGVIVEAQGVAIANGLQGWTVVAIYQQAADAGRVDARRSLESIKLTPPSPSPVPPVQPTTGRVEWKRYSPGETGLSLELPGEPKPYPLPFPQDVVDRVQDIKAYLYTGTKWIVLTNSFAIPKSWNLHSYAIGVVQGITDTKGVADVQYSLEPGTPERIPISGSYKMNGSAKMFNGFAVAKGSHIYMVTAVWPAADEAAQAAAKRVLESVQFSLQ